MVNTTACVVALAFMCVITAISLGAALLFWRKFKSAKEHGRMVAKQNSEMLRKFEQQSKFHRDKQEHKAPVIVERSAPKDESDSSSSSSSSSSSHSSEEKQNPLLEKTSAARREQLREILAAGTARSLAHDYYWKLWTWRLLQVILKENKRQVALLVHKKDTLILALQRRIVDLENELAVLLNAATVEGPETEHVPNSVFNFKEFSTMNNAELDQARIGQLQKLLGLKNNRISQLENENMRLAATAVAPEPNNSGSGGRYQNWLAGILPSGIGDTNNNAGALGTTPPTSPPMNPIPLSIPLSPPTPLNINNSNPVLGTPANLAATGTPANAPSTPTAATSPLLYFSTPPNNKVNTSASDIYGTNDGTTDYYSELSPSPQQTTSLLRNGQRAEMYSQYT